MRILKIFLILILSFSFLVVPVFGADSVVFLGLPAYVANGNTRVNGSSITFGFKDTATIVFSTEYTNISSFSVDTTSCNYSGDLTYCISTLNPDNKNYFSGTDIDLSSGYSATKNGLSIDSGYIKIYSSFAGTKDLAGLDILINGQSIFDSSSAFGNSLTDITVPAGYAFVLDNRGNDATCESITFSTIFPENVLFSTVRNGVSYNYYSYPSVSFSISDLTDWGSPVWFSKPSIFGQKRYVEKTINSYIGDDCFIVVNPLTYTNNNGKTFQNNDLKITFNGVEGQFKRYLLLPLAEYPSDNNYSGVTSVIDDLTDHYYVWKQEDENTGGWVISLVGSDSDVETDSDDTSIVPEGSITVPTVRVPSADMGVGSDDSLISNLVGIFSSGEESIQNVTNEGMSFFQFLGELWGWLPQRVLNVIWSVLIIFLIVGAIKLFH